MYRAATISLTRPTDSCPDSDLSLNLPGRPLRQTYHQRKTFSRYVAERQVRDRQFRHVLPVLILYLDAYILAIYFTLEELLQSGYLYMVFTNYHC